jgi:hypothetical protein
MRLAYLLPLFALTLVGCKSYNYVVPQKTPIMLVDAGQLKTFRLVDIDYSPAFSSEHVKNTYLIPDQVRKFDKDNADWAVSFCPPWLTSAAWTAGRWISAGQSPDLARWLVSANPVVVALGPQPLTSEPGGIRPITLNDQDQIVTRLLVLDHWQTPPAQFASPPPGVRTIELPNHPTLRKLFQQTPWK